ncbi:hypothetical protein AX768_29970 (plasmid) [Burkholderia sp. PAMC 28687]|nr:hypothetical protein AX768_29970 [Burkholderia sp. PAMC 28687]
MRDDATGINAMFNAVREPCAGKLARTVLRGLRFREGTWLPSKDCSFLICHNHPVFEEQAFDLVQAQLEAEILAHGGAVDASGETMTVIKLC